MTQPSRVLLHAEHRFSRRRLGGTQDGLAYALSLWHTVWTPSVAMSKYLDSEPVTEEELNELVEYGTLTVVDETWFTEDLDGEAPSIYRDPETESSGDDTAEGTAGGLEDAESSDDDHGFDSSYDSGNHGEE